MERAEPVEADRLGGLRYEGVDRGWVGNVVPRGVEVAGVEADAESWMAVGRVEERRKLGERAADRAARAGGVLHRQPGGAVVAVEDLLERGSHAPE